MTTKIAAWLVCGLTLACGQVASTPGADSGLPADAAGVACDVTKPFGAASEVPGLHDPNADDFHVTLTDDELTAYFGSSRGGGASGAYHVYAATRASRTAVFGTPALVAGTFSAQGDSNPAIASDGNTLIFDSLRVAAGAIHLFVTTRANPTVVFPDATLLPGDNLGHPSITADGKVLYAANLASGGLVRFDKAGAGFGAPQAVALSYPTKLVSPVSRDDLTMFLSKGDGTGTEILVTRRATTATAWPTPTTVTELKTTAVEAEPSWLSADGCRLYLRYKATASSKSTIFVATRPL